MNGYFDYEDYDFTQDYRSTALDVAVTVDESETTGSCDRCRLLPGDAVTVGGLTVVCACWMGQGAAEEVCQCGPEEGDAAGDGTPD